MGVSRQGQLWTAVRLESHPRGDDSETFLQIDEQIEHPKPPANLQPGSFVAGKQRVHRGDELEEFLRIKKYFGEFLGIPRFDQLKIQVHDSAQMALITSELLWASFRTPQHSVEHIGSFFARKHCDKNTAAPNRIDESGCIARQRPTTPGKTLIAKRIISGRVNLCDSPGTRKLFHHLRIFAQCLQE